MLNRRHAITRRQWLARSAVGVACFAVGRHVARAAASPFTLGVASGEPSADGFVLWTRLAQEPLAPDGKGGMSGPVPVAWELASDEGMRRIVQRGTAEADGHLAHSLHVEVSG